MVDDIEGLSIGSNQSAHLWHSMSLKEHRMNQLPSSWVTGQTPSKVGSFTTKGRKAMRQCLGTNATPVNVCDPPLAFRSEPATKLKPIKKYNQRPQQRTSCYDTPKLDKSLGSSADQQSFNLPLAFSISEEAWSEPAA